MKYLANLYDTKGELFWIADLGEVREIPPSVQFFPGFDIRQEFTPELAEELSKIREFRWHETAANGRLIYHEISGEGGDVTP